MLYNYKYNSFPTSCAGTSSGVQGHCRDMQISIIYYYFEFIWPQQRHSSFTCFYSRTVEVVVTASVRDNA